jgi:5,10-methylenetetrahydrofolate reductase
MSAVTLLSPALPFPAQPASSMQTQTAIMQIIELLENGVDGIHIYTMNNPDVARYIMEQIAEDVPR